MMKGMVRKPIKSLLAVLVVSIGGCLTLTEAWSQQKTALSYTVPAGATKYTQEHIIEVGDVPGHQVRVFELHYDDTLTGVAYGGVKGKESWIRGISDYTNGNGVANNHVVHILEDGSRIYSRASVLAQAGTNADGAKVLKFASVETLLGGTGRFSRIRGVLRATSERVVGASAAGSQVTGEYWFEE